jgi:hypothetical protein
MIRADHDEKIPWLFFDDTPSGGNWVTGLAIGVAVVIILPLASPIFRPLGEDRDQESAA